MTTKQIAEYQNAASDGLIQDDKNPIFLFATTDSELLVKILRNEFDVHELAIFELGKRGLNPQGKNVEVKISSALPNRKNKTQHRL